jgi:uncharacterized membrane protein (UPF0127 family)
MVLRLKWIVALSIGLQLSSAFALRDSDKVAFKKKPLTIEFGQIIKKITVEMAETDDQHERGLMFRKKLSSNEGMLFVFKDEMTRHFWMKNTLIDLSIGYFNAEKKLIDVQEMKAVTSVLQTDLPSYPSRLPAQFALEMPAGWFKKSKIAEGAILKF